MFFLHFVNSYFSFRFNNKTQDSAPSKSIPQVSRDENHFESNGSPPLPPPPILDFPECSSPINEEVQPFGMPSLPEPTEKPPPPPMIHQDEPIYEAIKPRNDLSPISKVFLDFIEIFIFVLLIYLFDLLKNFPRTNGTTPTEPVVTRFDRDNRDARRKLRINRKLQELEDDDVHAMALQVYSYISSVFYWHAFFYNAMFITEDEFSIPRVA